MKKIKQSLNISTAPVKAVFAAATAVLLGLRMYHLVSLIDSETGFFDTKNFTVTVFYAVLAVACLSIAVLSYLGKKTAVSDVTPGKNIPLCVMSAVTAAALFYDSLFSFVSSVSAIAAPSGTGSLGAFQTMMKSGALPLFFEAIFAIPSAVYFIFLAAGFGKESDKFKSHKLLALMPIGWAVLRMIRRFVTQISFVNVSDLLLELLMIAFVLLFLMAFAQVASGVYADGFQWRLAGFGLPAAMLGIVTSLPRFIFVIIGKSELINASHPLYPCDIALAAFIIVLVFTARRAAAHEAVGFPEMGTSAAE